jgi:hypothetical protein
MVLLRLLYVYPYIFMENVMIVQMRKRAS